MKQIVPGIVPVILIVSMYVIFASLQKAGVLDEQNTAAVETKTVEIKKPEAEKPVYKAPASTPESKRLFLENTIAAITKVKKRLDAQYQMVYELSLKEKLTPDENATIEGLKKSYNVEGFPCLLKCLRTHPVSIVIAQAALETGWGNSRFYREANNIFGIWSFNKNEPRIAAGVQREGEKTIYVKKYKNLEASIEGYYRMMAKGRAYKQFREARLHTENPFEIIPYLDHYSELRHEYVKRLYYVIKSNRFYELDNHLYQPPGWTNIKPADPKYLKIVKKPAEKVAEKCTKENNATIDSSLSGDANSSKATDITVLSQETGSDTKPLAHTADLPHAHDLNKTIDQNSSNKKPIEVQDVNTAGV